MSCDVLCLVVFCDVLCSLTMSCAWCLVVSYDVLWCLVMSYEEAQETYFRRILETSDSDINLVQLR